VWTRERNQAACDACIQSSGGSGEAHAIAAAADRGGPTVKIAPPKQAVLPAAR